MTNNKIDFFIVGAARSGTTTLWHWLKGHPQIFLPETKEPHYFCFMDTEVPYCGKELDPDYRKLLITDKQKYDQLYLNGKQGQLRGDASPGYLYFRHTAARIREHNPDAKIICILRDPCSRAFSQFMLHIRSGFEDVRNFDSALAKEKFRISKGWWWGHHYLEAGKYAEQWQVYCDQFPKSQRLLLFYDDLSKDPTGTYRKICKFLNIPSLPNAEINLRFNTTAELASVPRFFALHRALLHGAFGSRFLHFLIPKSVAQLIRRLIINFNIIERPELSASGRQKLLEYYESDIDRISKLSGRDLSSWKR